MSEPKVEIWKGKKVIVVRNKKGWIDSWIYYKDINLEAAKRIYKDKGTFRKDVKKISVQELTNVREISINTQGQLIFRKNKGGQYYIKWKSKKSKSWQAVRSNTAIITSREVAERLKEQAYERFYSFLAMSLTGQYDADEGEKWFHDVADKLDMEEGFTYFQKK